MLRPAPTPPHRHPRLRLSAVILLSGALVAAAPRVSASESKSSNSGSSNSSDSNSSNGSKDSSNSSKDSSNNSNASSKDSNNSTQNSPQRTSDWSSKGTSDWSTKSRGGQVFSVALAVVVVGASVVGSVGASRSRADAARPATVALAAYLRQHHALLTHDVALASGPIFDAWARDLHLGRRDRRALEHSLDGSADQGLLLDALDGPIDDDHARRFAAAFLRATARAIGPDRTRALVIRADAAAGAAHDHDG